MWMMGYNYDGVEFNSIDQGSFNGRNNLRPLIPRTTCTNPPPCFHGTDLLTLNHHLAMAADQNKREINCTQQVVVSSRWNPTPEQLQTLEELYRRGTRTPSADQIQHITAQLRRYGKIEGKNVFYWFQNHKARERQKRRRQLDSDDPPHNYNTQTQHGEKKESSPEENGTVIYEVEQSKNWASPTNSSTTLAEKNVATQAAACKQDGWLQFDRGDRRDATWQMMHLSNCSSSPAAATNHLIISSSPPPPATSSMEPYILNNFHHSAAQTLLLFPLGSAGCDDDKEEERESGGAMNAAMIGDVTPPYQFFEFLPLKK